jgi:hypothetical protein
MSTAVNSNSLSPWDSWLGLTLSSDQDIDPTEQVDQPPAILPELGDEPPSLEEHPSQSPAKALPIKETKPSTTAGKLTVPQYTQYCFQKMTQKMIRERENTQVSLFFAHRPERESRSKTLTIFPPQKPSSPLGDEREITFVQEETLTAQDSSSSSQQSSFPSACEANLHTGESPLVPESNK